MATTGGGLAGGAKIAGKAMGGNQPIIGAAVTFYATGNSGYGSAATVLGTATSDGSGNFTIALNSNSCSDPQQVYLVASGGDTGAGINTASVLVSALGTCSSVSGATTGININEVSTVAAAYALQGFVAASDTVGANIGTSSTNAQGLTHAFANAANLATIGGVARTTTAGGNGTVPNAVINTLGNILASCVNSTASASACTSFLLGAPSVVGAPTPTNVWMEALDMARYPGYQAAALYALAPAAAVYQPTLAAVPNDLSIGIAYSAGFETNGTTAAGFPWDIKADSADNIWISGMTSAGLVELSPGGALLSPSNGGWGNATLQGTFTRGIAFDTTASSNVWIADGTGNIWEYTPAGTATAPTAGTTTQIPAASPKGPVGIGVDSANNVWFGTEGTASAAQGIGEVAAGTTAATYPSNSAFNSTASAGTYTLFVDAANGNHIFAGTQSSTAALGGVFYEYTSTAAPLETTTVGGTTTSAATNGVAVDKNGFLWGVYTGSGVNGGSLSKFTVGTATANYTCKVAVTTGNGLYNPRGLVIDGNNRMYVTSYTAGSIIVFDPSLGTACDTASDPGTFFTTPTGSGISPVNSAGTAIIEASAARNETIDSSGALWTMNGASNASYQPVVQILGLAAPTNPVFAAGKYGVKP